MTNPRLLHTMLRVKDLDASVAFYTKLLGMKELRRNEVPGGRYTKFKGTFGPPMLIARLDMEFTNGQPQRVVSDGDWRVGTGAITFDAAGNPIATTSSRRVVWRLPQD